MIILDLPMIKWLEAISVADEPGWYLELTKCQSNLASKLETLDTCRSTFNLGWGDVTDDVSALNHPRSYLLNLKSGILTKVSLIVYL